MIYFIYFSFLFSHRLLAQVAGKKNKIISFRVRSPDNHSQFQNKMRVQNPYPFSDRNAKTIPFGAAHTYIPDIAEYPPPEMIKYLISLNSNGPITLWSCGFFSSYLFSKNAKKSGNDTASFFLPEPNHDGWTVID